MSAGEQSFDRDDLLALLAELGRELAGRGLHADLYVVGGAAIALTLDARRATRDVDAVLRSGSADLRVAAAEVARRHGLSRGWLDSAVAAFTPGADDPDAVGLELPGLTVALASPEHLLAMKMVAARPGRDIDDLVLLFAHLGLTQPAQALAIVQRLYGDDDVVMSDPPESYLYLAEDVLTRLAAERDRS